MYEVKIIFPELPIVQESEINAQVAKVREEAAELIEAIELCKPSNKSDLYDMLGEALDTAQAIAGLLEMIDDATLETAVEIHDEKLRRKYRARGYMAVIRREER